MNATDTTELVTAGALYELCERLYPICRSITGTGVRQTLRDLSELIDLELHEVPSGTSVFDWTVPLEWNLQGAYIESADGRRLIDARDSNLHVVGYSVPVDERLSREALEPHLHSLPERPDVIPYRTSYYAPSWGFCLSQRQRDDLGPGPFRAVIDSTLTEGSLTYGEYLVPGRSDREILVSTHVCHPSLANDNLSGIAVAANLARYFAHQPRGRYGIRFVFIPATIGAITWLARNERMLDRIVAGLVLSGLGNAGAFTYKLSRNAEGLIDRVCERLIRSGAYAGEIRPFSPYGYDERQYCSPGVNIPAGCLMRTPFGEYPEYHTSADNLGFISPEALKESFDFCVNAIEDAQAVVRYRNLSPNGEPQLGRRGLYAQMGGDNESKIRQLAMLWLLAYSDGAHSSADISDLSGISLADLAAAAQALVAAELLEEIPGGGMP